MEETGRRPRRVTRRETVLEMLGRGWEIAKYLALLGELRYGQVGIWRWPFRINVN